MDSFDPMNDFPLEDDLLDLSINASQKDEFNDLTLVGFIISDKTLTFRVVRAILTSWNLGSHLQISALDRNMISCTFNKVEDKNRIFKSKRTYYSVSHLATEPDCIWIGFYPLILLDSDL